MNLNEIAKLPDKEDFWNAVNSDQNKQFLVTCLFELIRNTKPKTEQERIEYISKAQTLVGLFDAANGFYEGLLAKKIYDKEQKEIAELID